MSIMKSTFALGIFVVSLCHPTQGELRGLKKGSKKASGLTKGSKKLSIGIDYDQSADKCKELIPEDVQPDTFGLNMNEICVGDFWIGEEPWTFDNAEFNSFLPACLCVMYAKDCFIQAVTTYHNMYGLALTVGLSEDEAVDFANAFIDEDCISYAQTLLEQRQTNPTPPSNDSS